MKKHFPPSKFPTNGASAVANEAAIAEIERRVVNQQKHLPATSIEYEYAADEAIASVRVVIWGTPEDVVQYLVARARTGANGDEVTS